jgi:hypothetical protein
MLMIQRLNDALDATSKVFVLEDGILKIIKEIDREITGGGNKLIVLTGLPGSGITSALEQLSALNKRSVVRMQSSIYIHSPGFLERLIESFGMTVHRESLKNVPRYLVEILSISGRKTIIIDDFDLFWQSIEDVRKFCSEAFSLFEECNGINIVVSIRVKKIFDWLMANSAEAPQHIFLPSFVEGDSARIFSEKYSRALGFRLNWQVFLPGFDFQKNTILEISRTIRAATVVSFLRSESMLDLNLLPRKGDDYVLRRYLEIAATA